MQFIYQSTHPHHGNFISINKTNFCNSMALDKISTCKIVIDTKKELKYNLGLSIHPFRIRKLYFRTENLKLKCRNVLP